MPFLLCQYYIWLHPALVSFEQVVMIAKVSIAGNLPIFVWFASMLFLGACFHILEDAVCGKVPGLTMRQRVGVKLFYVGSMREYLFVWGVSLAVVAVRLKMEHFI